MAPFAFVTLLTTDSYLPGALVTVQSLREAEGPTPAASYDTVCLVTPETVTVESVKALRQAFTLVIGVEEIRSDSREELKLLGRQDLASSLTKLHLWRLVQYQKVIFLDADTLVLRPLSSLFHLPHVFAAAPDTGWPDCFNSGMMVCTPALETFDALMGMARERGSWDGGDQGLLNDYFPNWHRLSFTFNVTPSAYYTYAPAYRRHGDDISLVHFIGQEKPWHRLSNRHPPARRSEPSASDYSGLLDRWYSVYEKSCGPIPTAAVSDGAGAQRDFTVPVYAAAWDVAQPSHYTPPSTEQLRAMFTRSSAAPTVEQPQPVKGTTIEGGYMSLPLPGRPSLMRPFPPDAPEATLPVAPPETSSAPRATPSTPDARLSAEPLAEPANAASTAPPPPAAMSRSGSATPTATTSHPFVPPPSQPSPPSPPSLPYNQVWDAAKQPPPKTGQQMRVPITARYDAVWDAPDQSKAAKQFFRPPSYVAMPEVTHQDYSRTMSHIPNQSAVKPVFPWEDEKKAASRPRPARVFPEDPPLRPLPDLSKPHSPREVMASSPRSPIFSTGVRYPNAWDIDPHIKRYAESLGVSPSHGRESRTPGDDEGRAGLQEGSRGGSSGSSKRRPSAHSKRGSAWGQAGSDPGQQVRSGHPTQAEYRPPEHGHRGLHHGDQHDDSSGRVLNPMHPGHQMRPIFQSHLHQPPRDYGPGPQGDRLSYSPVGSARRSGSSPGHTLSFSFSSQPESDASSHDGDDEDDLAADDDLDPESTSGPHVPRPKGAEVPPSTLSTGLPAQSGPRRPWISKRDGSTNSVARLPTVKSVIIGVPAPQIAGSTTPGVQEGVELGLGGFRERMRRNPSLSPLRGGPASLIAGGEVKPRSENSVSSSTSALKDSQPLSPSVVQPAAATRVFSASTDPGVLRQNGLDVLNRFIQEMEGKAEKSRSTKAY